MNSPLLQKAVIIGWLSLQSLHSTHHQIIGLYMIIMCMMSSNPAKDPRQVITITRLTWENKLLVNCHEWILSNASGHCGRGGGGGPWPPPTPPPFFLDSDRSNTTLYLLLQVMLMCRSQDMRRLCCVHKLSVLYQYKVMIRCLKFYEVSSRFLTADCLLERGSITLVQAKS